MSDDVRELLENVATRLASGEGGSNWSAAFDMLIQAWRTLRASEIAEIVEALSARAAKGKKVDGKTQTESVVTWAKMFQERSALGLGVLIADLDAPWNQGAQPRFVLPRIEALANVRDDPRIASAMLRVLPRTGYGKAWRKVLTRCLRGLEAAGDPRVIAQLAKAENPATGMEGLKHLRKKLPEKPPALPEDLHPIVDAIRTSIEAIADDVVIPTPPRERAAGTDPEALLDQVRASPDDDALRLVLADALDAMGDPLGEFIVLQMRRASGENATPKTLARERALVKTNIRKWLGPLAAAVTLKSCVFERGFLERCHAVVHRSIDAQIHFNHPQWATVRSIFFQDQSRITGAMRSLREALSVENSGLNDLAVSGHPTLERLGIASRVMWGFDVVLKGLESWSAERLPKLVHIEVGNDGRALLVSQMEAILDMPWAKQIKSFGVGTLETLAAFLEVFAKREHLERLECGRANSNIGVHLQRTPEGFTARVSLDEASLLENQYANQTRAVVFNALGGMARLREVIIEAPSAKTASNEKVVNDAVALLKNAPQVTLPSSLSN